MLVLLSSGATRRYRDDIIRALALPVGAELQFRYDRRYIHKSVLDRIDASNFRAEQAIVLYLWSDKEKLQTACVPCRFATVESAEFAGSSCIVRLRIGKFVNELSDSKFRSALDVTEASLVPSWQVVPEKGPSLNGSFFFAIRNDFSGHASDSISAFEATAVALVQFKDFAAAQGTVFYTISRLIKVEGKIGDATRRSAPVYPVDGSYHLASGQRYEMEVYCFNPPVPGIEARLAQLHIDSDVEAVSFPLGKSREIDSRYDLKRFPLHVPQQIEALAAGLRVYLTDAPPDNRSYSDIIIPAHFSGSLKIALARAAIIGIGTSGPAMIAAYSSAKLNFGIAVLMLLLGLLAGAGTIFSTLKKN